MRALPRLTEHTHSDTVRTWNTRRKMWLMCPTRRSRIIYNLSGLILYRTMTPRIYIILPTYTVTLVLYKNIFSKLKCTKVYITYMHTRLPIYHRGWILAYFGEVFCIFRKANCGIELETCEIETLEEWIQIRKFVSAFKKINSNHFRMYVLCIWEGRTISILHIDRVRERKRERVKEINICSFCVFKINHNIYFWST